MRWREEGGEEDFEYRDWTGREQKFRVGGWEEEESGRKVSGLFSVQAVGEASRS